MNEEQWPTKKQAAQLTGISVRTIERHIAAGKIEARPTDRGIVCNPADLEQLRGGLLPAIAAPPQAAPQAGELASIVGTLLRHWQPPPIEDPELYRFLTLEEAAAESGLSTRFLQRAIRAKQLPVIRDGRAHKVSRRSLRRWTSELSE